MNYLFDIDTQKKRLMLPSDTTKSFEIYKLQKKLESYITTVSQLGLGLHSEGSSSEVSESSLW